MMNKHSLILILFITLFIHNSFSQNDSIQKLTPVEEHKQLTIDGRFMKDESQNPVSLHGMSLFWSQWGGKFYNKKCIAWLAEDWKCNIVRAALGVSPNGYLKHPKRESKKIIRVIDGAIDAGIYVIVDWHDHHAEEHQEQAEDFFEMIAKKYGSYPNIIYEIYNEPINVSWHDTIKPYAGKIIETIRKYDPDNIIIVGTPRYSQNVDEAALDPLPYNNIAYALHFYSGTHQQWLRDTATIALDNSIALFVSEWGGSNADANGDFHYKETERWIQFMNKYQISWCNWSVFTKNETTSILRKSAGRHGNWKTSDLTDTGIYMRNLIRKLNTE